jgi:GNAT superfamily N-acetyltransferase
VSVRPTTISRCVASAETSSTRVSPRIVFAFLLPVFVCRPWAAPSAPALIRYLISNLISRCVFVDGIPACWSVEKVYGAIGFLHTQPTYRSRGLASLCVEAMSEALVARDTTLPVHAEVTHGNAASERVFSKCGFTRSHDVVWVMAKPNNNK